MEQEFQLCNVTSPIMKYYILLTNLPSKLLVSATLSIMTTTHTTSSKKRSCNEWLLARRAHEVPSSYPRLWTDACPQNFSETSSTPIPEPTRTWLPTTYVRYLSAGSCSALSVDIRAPDRTGCPDHSTCVGSNRHSSCNPGLSSGPGRRTHGKYSSVLLP